MEKLSKKQFAAILITAALATFVHFSNCMQNNLEIGKQETIEKYLRFTLPLPSTISFPKIKKVTEHAFKKIYDSADYASAVSILFSGLQRYPQSFTLQFYFAALLGDYAELFSGNLQKRIFQKANDLFSVLLQEVHLQPKEIVYSFKNEYYYRSGLHKEQFELGKRRVDDYWDIGEWTDVGIKGYYCQGVGAANHAKQLMIKGDFELAYSYAQNAIVAWAQYFAYKNDYYNAYVHYALALGILGYKKEMLRALQRSAQLINKDLEYEEFKEVTDFINSLPLSR